MAAKKPGQQKRAALVRLPEPILKRRSARPAPAELPETISWWDAFYRVVRRIPRGRVCTYGGVAAMAGNPRAARHVGYALGALKETGENAGVPWQRVLGGRSRRRAAITIKDPVGGALQQMLLEAEGVEFDENGSVSLDRFGWFQSTPERATKRTPTNKKRATKPLKAKPLKAKPVKAKPVKAKPLKAKPVKAKPVKAKPLKAKPFKKSAAKEPTKRSTKPTTRRAS